mmetsp:Transcript_35536/g.76848  ORF Transcript_35536/g.76848 Transcript_35536/m.76848 type:complete len:194 (-) Transcript_35536:1031-1612(-)
MTSRGSTFIDSHRLEFRALSLSLIAVGAVAWYRTTHLRVVFKDLASWPVSTPLSGKIMRVEPKHILFCHKAPLRRDLSAPVRLSLAAVDVTPPGKELLDKFVDKRAKATLIHRETGQATIQLQWGLLPWRRCVSHHLVSKGLATVQRDAKETVDCELLTSLTEAEDQAKANRVGVWQEAPTSWWSKILHFVKR